LIIDAFATEGSEIERALHRTTETITILIGDEPELASQPVAGILPAFREERGVDWRNAGYFGPIR
jgi:hypothetical protein